MPWPSNVSQPVPWDVLRKILADFVIGKMRIARKCQRRHAAAESRCHAAALKGNVVVVAAGAPDRIDRVICIAFTPGRSRFHIVRGGRNVRRLSVPVRRTHGKDTIHGCIDGRHAASAFVGSTLYNQAAGPVRVVKRLDEADIVVGIVEVRAFVE